MRLRSKIVLLIAVLVTGVGTLSSVVASRVICARTEKNAEERAAVITQTIGGHVMLSVMNGEVIPAREGLLEIVRRT